ncbi:Methyltransferase domain-containing protein [Salinibacillus kushneri]|uniref:Methyltransferase domain-containing protein n=1 Tax=Salinibacillus kushneri TaxID=237682 RepID=A0A1I0BGW4_9BACI|nr:class I SAM-dependent methyltransferase [Salinibacillus kushneri]SET06052.1 Methyltransferase domain-containing protein [Salinibacillus kushneri]
MLQDTGERVIPDNMDSMNMLLLEHLARYQFSLPHVHGRVLDLSCGAGYGTQFIAKRLKNEIHEVIGIDIDKDVIHYAKGRYHHPKASYYVKDATDPSLPQQLGQFDSIISFETLEHIAKEEKLLQNYYQLLKPGGTLIVSTPFGKGRGKKCGSPFHVHQLTPGEFRDLFTSYQEVSFFYQNGVLIEPHPPKEGVYYPLGIAVSKK